MDKERLFEIGYGKREKGYDLSDINVFQKAYNDNYRLLKYFGLQYLPDEDIISEDRKSVV